MDIFGFNLSRRFGPLVTGIPALALLILFTPRVQAQTVILQSQQRTYGHQLFCRSGSAKTETLASRNDSASCDSLQATSEAKFDAYALDSTRGVPVDSPGNSTGATSFTNGTNDWVHRWLVAVDTARSEQPHYVAPLITTHVDLVQQFRFDSYQQTASSGAGTFNFGAGKGLEIIPNTRMEVQVGLPPYMMHQAPHMPDGFGDVSIFLKFRVISAPEHMGDYFVGFFLGGSFPSGTPPNGMGHTVWTPMFAAAKGWGHFDWQTNLAGNLPQSGTIKLGRLVLFNNTFQYSIAKHLWPEIETNSTFFVDGPNSGKNETFLTPGLLIGPFDIAERLHFEPGGGIQIAVTQFHQYDHRWIWTLRFPF